MPKEQLQPLTDGGRLYLTENPDAAPPGSRLVKIIQYKTVEHRTWSDQAPNPQPGYGGTITINRTGYFSCTHTQYLFVTSRDEVIEQLRASIDSAEFMVRDISSKKREVEDELKDVKRELENAKSSEGRFAMLYQDCNKVKDEKEALLAKANNDLRKLRQGLGDIEFEKILARYT